MVIERGPDRQAPISLERIRQIEHHALKRLEKLQDTQRLRNDIEIAFYWPRPKRHT
jgi:hypothetical protein